MDRSNFSSDFVNSDYSTSVPIRFSPCNFPRVALHQLCHLPKNSPFFPSILGPYFVTEEVIVFFLCHIFFCFKCVCAQKPCRHSGNIRSSSLKRGSSEATSIKGTAGHFVMTVLTECFNDWLRAGSYVRCPAYNTSEDAPR